MKQPTQAEALRIADALEYCDASVARQAINELRRLHAENEALLLSLAKANSQAEHFEREWYLRGDELESLRGSQQAERAVPTDAMVRAALKVQFPASYREHLHHPANGPKTSARTSKEIDMARRMIAAALAAAPVQQAAPAGNPPRK